MQATNLLELYPAAPRGEQADSSLHKIAPPVRRGREGHTKSVCVRMGVIHHLSLFLSF